MATRRPAPKSPAEEMVESKRRAMRAELAESLGHAARRLTFDDLVHRAHSRRRPRRDAVRPAAGRGRRGRRSAKCAARTRPARSRLRPHPMPGARRSRRSRRPPTRPERPERARCPPRTRRSRQPGAARGVEPCRQESASAGGSIDAEAAREGQASRSTARIKLLARAARFRRFVAHLIHHLLTCFRRLGTLDGQRDAALQQRERTIFASCLDLGHHLSTGFGALEVIRVFGVALLIGSRMVHRIGLC